MSAAALYTRQFEYEHKKNDAASFSFEFHLNENSNCFDKFVTVSSDYSPNMGKSQNFTI